MCCGAVARPTKNDIETKALKTFNEKYILILELENVLMLVRMMIMIKNNNFPYVIFI